MTDSQPAGSTESARVRDHFATTAAEVDSGHRDIREGLSWLGEQGLLRPSEERHERVGRALSLLRSIAAASLSDAFAAWSQIMVTEYLTCCPPGPALAPSLEELISGLRPGATALAPAVADVAGGPPVPVLASRTGTGSVLTGTVSWASNLFTGALLVVPARTPDGGRLVAALSLEAPGVAVAPSPPLLALNGTGTGSVALDDTPVPLDAVLSTSLTDFLALCRPTMLATQAALALGVTDASLAAVVSHIDRGATSLLGDYEALTAQRDAATAQLAASTTWLADPTSTAPATARVNAVEVAAQAVALEGLAHGGAGFRAGTATSRRRREVAFLPLQAPTLLQLREALSR